MKKCIFTALAKIIASSMKHSFQLQLLFFCLTNLFITSHRQYIPLLKTIKLKKRPLTLKSKKCILLFLMVVEIIVQVTSVFQAYFFTRPINLSLVTERNTSNIGYTNSCCNNYLPGLFFAIFYRKNYTNFNREIIFLCIY